MAQVSSWREQRGGATYRLPGAEHIGTWATIAMLVSLLLHVGVFFFLDNLKIAIGFQEARELSTLPINIQQIEVRADPLDTVATPEAVITPPVDAASLLDDIDLLEALPKDAQIELSPSIDQAEYELKMVKPAMEGDPHAIAMEVTASMEAIESTQEFGREPSSLKPAEIGQITIDPGSASLEDDSMGTLTDELVKRGANGSVPKGALDGVESLDALLDLPPNVLVGKKTMLPSDLLFEFNRAELRESAKVGLMKLALLMDRNPELYCWIEGHSDMIGGDAFNIELSKRRAEAVKQHLVNSLRMDSEKIITRGFGRANPIVKEGDSEAQSINRRVEVRMRKIKPPAERAPAAGTEENIEAPPKAAVIAPPEDEPSAPPKAILVKPKRALPVEPSELVEPAPPRANPVEEDVPLRAAPVEEEDLGPEPPRATVIDEE